MYIKISDDSKTTIVIQYRNEQREKINKYRLANKYIVNLVIKMYKKFKAHKIVLDLLENVSKLSNLLRYILHCLCGGYHSL